MIPCDTRREARRDDSRSAGRAGGLEAADRVAKEPVLSRRLELPPHGTGNGQQAMAARAERQDEPPGPRALGIATADGEGEHDVRFAAANGGPARAEPSRQALTHRGLLDTFRYPPIMVVARATLRGAVTGYLRPAIVAMLVLGHL